MSDYWHKPWACPYFKWDTKKALACEAGQITFPDVRTACAYYDQYCAAVPGWEKCTLSIAITKYYEEGDRELEKVSKEDLELLVLELKKKKEDLEHELGRWKKKVNDQVAEIREKDKRLEEYEVAAGQVQVACDTAIASMVKEFGQNKKDRYVVKIKAFNAKILDDYEVKAKTEDGSYILEAIKVRKQENK